MKVIKKQKWIIIGILVVLCGIIGFIYPLDKVQAPNEPIEESYDQNSWKTQISENCKSFFDGCNNCSRMEGEVVCTKMYCEVYEQPKCVDEDEKEESLYCDDGSMCPIES